MESGDRMDAPGSGARISQASSKAYDGDYESDL